LILEKNYNLKLENFRIKNTAHQVKRVLEMSLKEQKRFREIRRDRILQEKDFEI
jgi:hypothetical protein